MSDVMDVKPTAPVASGHPAAPITFLDDDASAVWHGTEGSADAHRPAAGLQHRADTGVASQEAAETVADAGTEVEVAVGGGVHVEKHEVPLVVGADGAPERPLGHDQEGVGPVDVCRTGIRRLVVFSGPEQLVSRRDQRPLDQRAFVGRQLGRQPPPAGIGVAEADRRRSGSSGRGRSCSDSANP